ncbi:MULTISPECIES: NUDIX hydrolase [Alicyclobacillus]|uniref:8-oxo-dGTP pyrophosphatase MutT (NUDIX family) n=1 Tax=Alicyclobacillus tolerans TaxID=90970 RepID=A0ABT9LWG7_9BACL|nr:MULTISPECIES: NUDIX hydrolase [Alicyclobacillus]MDP9728615.1 8-oxo-dGTP pyrophosphatase MutT (NUDIX family) [Alicyclobacillus tengchongensis]
MAFHVRLAVRRGLLKIYGLLPRGLTSRLIKLVHPSVLLAVVGVVFRTDGSFLLLHHSYHKPRWRLPGGLVNRGESLQDAVCREILEEAGCLVEILSFIDAASLAYSYDVAWLLRLVEERPFSPSAEIVDRVWVDFSQRQEWGLTKEQLDFLEKGYELWKKTGSPLP